MVSPARGTSVIVAILFLSALALLQPGAAMATAESSGGYESLPEDAVAARSSHAEPQVLLVDDRIWPGETKHVKKKVDRFITTLNVDLQWDNDNADLAIAVFSPAGTQFGPWTGGSDRRISKDISNRHGIEQGEWYYYVYNWGTEPAHFSV